MQQNLCEDRLTSIKVQHDFNRAVKELAGTRQTLKRYDVTVCGPINPD